MLKMPCNLHAVLLFRVVLPSFSIGKTVFFPPLYKALVLKKQNSHNNFLSQLRVIRSNALSLTFIFFLIPWRLA